MGVQAWLQVSGLVTGFRFWLWVSGFGYHTKFNESSYRIWPLTFSLAFILVFNIGLDLDLVWVLTWFQLGYSFQVWLRVPGLITGFGFTTIFRLWLQFSGFGTFFRVWLKVPGCPRILTNLVLDLFVPGRFSDDISS